MNMAEMIWCFSRTRRTHSLYSIVVGIVVGFVFVYHLRSFTFQNNSGCLFVRSDNKNFKDGRSKSLQSVVEDASLSSGSSLLFIGVMTAQKYLDTRAVAIYNTWGQTVPGKMLFFSSFSSKASGNIPLVPLPGVDDSYPPQKKSFLMLKYIHDHYLNKYEWFMRADDDVYIRTDRLEKLLRSVNSSKPQFIGQAGMGSKEELGQLSLEPDENFCMGGPGMIMSRDTLKMVIPHIQYCLKNLYSTHEDVEVGRCIRKFVGIPCTWSYEMQSIFYHSFNGEGVFTGRLKIKEVHRAITLHPIKQPPYLYRLHSYFHGLHTQTLRYHTLLLHRELLEMSKLLSDSHSLITYETSYGNTSILGLKPHLNKFYPATQDEVLRWKFFTKSIYSSNTLNPKRRFEAYQQTALNDVVMEVMEMINKYSKQRGRIIDFKDALYGYIRINPLCGVDYILDMLLTYKKYRGRKMTVPVRRHAYLQQIFSRPEVQEVYSEDKPLTQINTYQTVNFILPLSGRLDTFKRFLNNFEEVCLQHNERVSLTVVLFSDDSGNNSAETKSSFDDIVNHFPGYELRLIEANGSFSRALALEIGARVYSLDALLFFVDVDIILDNEVLNRIRLNTIKGRQAYFPVVFSEYDPHYVYKEQNKWMFKPMLHDDNGYWRKFGFGIVSLYNSDLKSVGGLDITIQGWGKEDVDLFTKVVHSNISAFRAADIGLIHLFHPIHCSSELENSQYEMCWGSKLSSLAPQRKVAEIVLSNQEKFFNGYR